MYIFEALHSFHSCLWQLRIFLYKKWKVKETRISRANIKVTDCAKLFIDQVPKHMFLYTCVGN
jgi:hypothetical protein